jgi:DNA-binding NtrC family response regulator
VQSQKKPLPTSRSRRDPATGEPSTRLVAWSPDRLPTLKEAEDALIAEAMSRADGNQGVAAGLLGVSRQALNKRLRRRDQPELSAEPPE